MGTDVRHITLFVRDCFYFFLYYIPLSPRQRKAHFIRYAHVLVISMYPSDSASVSVPHRKPWFWFELGLSYSECVHDTYRRRTIRTKKARGAVRSNSCDFFRTTPYRKVRKKSYPSKRVPKCVPIQITLRASTFMYGVVYNTSIFYTVEF